MKDPRYDLLREQVASRDAWWRDGGEDPCLTQLLMPEDRDEARLQWQARLFAARNGWSIQRGPTAAVAPVTAPITILDAPTDIVSLIDAAKHVGLAGSSHICAAIRRGFLTRYISPVTGKIGVSQAAVVLWRANCQAYYLARVQRAQEKLSHA